jgi:formate dehydrogenase subunit gamma
MSATAKAEPTVGTRWVKRYTTAERWLHWGHTVTFFMLAATGMVLFIPQLRELTQGQAGYFIRRWHRYSAVLFTLVPFIYLIFEPGRLVKGLKDIGFGADDIGWFKNAWAYYIRGEQGKMPPQGRFNTGEKMNIWVNILGGIIFALTGYTMWFAKSVGDVPWGISPQLFQACVIVHDLTMIASFNFFLVHLYLAVAHPMMWGGLTGIRFGVVSEEYLKEHHPKWHQELQRELAEAEKREKEKKKAAAEEG